MPDMERIIDSLQLELERDPLRKMWRRGFIAGKKRARIEVAIVVAGATLTFLLLRWWANA